MQKLQTKSNVVRAARNSDADVLVQIAGVDSIICLALTMQEAYSLNRQLMLVLDSMSMKDIDRAIARSRANKLDSVRMKAAEGRPLTRQDITLWRENTKDGLPLVYQGKKQEDKRSAKSGRTDKRTTTITPRRRTGK